MKRSIGRVLFPGLLLFLVSTPIQGMFSFWSGKTSKPAASQASWGQWFKNCSSSIKTSIYESSTETKVLVGCAALVAAGASYLWYRYLNPTDNELCARASTHIYRAENQVAKMPNITPPLNAQRLDAIGLDLHNAQECNPSSLKNCMTKSVVSLNGQKDILNQRLVKHEKACQFGAVELTQNVTKINSLVPQLTARIAILNNHAHYFRMVDLLAHINYFSPAIACKNDMNALAPLIHGLTQHAQFPYLGFVQDLNYESERIVRELGTSIPASLGTPEHTYYITKRIALRQLAVDLTTVKNTVLSSKHYQEDQIRKDKHDAEQRKIALENARLAQERERIRIEAERARIERERLQLEREKNQREREAHQQQYPNAPRSHHRQSGVQGGCEIQ